MIDDRDLIRHLEEGGSALWNPREPPPLDLVAIVGAPTTADTARDASAAPPATPAARPARWRTLLRPRTFTMPPLGMAAGAMACLAVGLVIGSAVMDRDSQDTAPTLAAAPVPTKRIAMQPLGHAPASASAIASVFSTTDGKSIDVKIAGLPPLENGTFYELWVLGKAGKMVSLGTFSVNAKGQGSASMPLPVSLNRFPVLDISLEHADGNPAHSGDSLLRAPV